MNAHAQVSICGPSRASYLTSKQPDTIKVWNINQKNALAARINSMSKRGKRLVTIPRMFKENGYTVLGYGKIAHENELTYMKDSATWTEPVYTWQNNYVRPPTFTSPYTGSWIDYPNVADDRFCDGQAAEMAAARIRAIAGAGPGYTPFAIFVGLWKPHLPWRVPLKYALNNAGTSYPAAHHGGAPSGQPVENWRVPLGDGCGEVSAYAPFGNLAGWTTSDNQQRSANRAYVATIDYMDAQVQKLLDAIDTTHARDNTYIVFTGDHGFHLGDHGLWCKV